MKAQIREALDLAAAVGPREPDALDLLAEVLVGLIVDTYGPPF
ncbi:hypothetical protein C731_2969 [Mycolicibacterium hassiacum DSM 44199]|uniref:Uncharacterized protein n=1 Tax=Mycolicibacterium hassiacum (strain DSM 44199 / CIP 105218 / JCM 12690 / 3849) TaxID=1122247 RepID=K5BFD4_MYCHD|nr:hypothetical protein [Mycolicibacterium hassiacum]ARQ94634.1 hypothetical protein SEA_JOURNEY13_61 [Mycobacterium phage Journey13]ASZ75235.1 hypothetical protein PBI_MISSWHITE_69 [Mycobacterium phage MissWhite]EKF23071.1 hypothetical protein C731_2969 [Mycolicibacterium hassiacum DSM 44199]MDA4086047.1 hypothetical protein [Mycolicibacterium hassiacum DSM 44199]VCT89503.1 hypothetical protein MHAS_01197 [Mycolicibacterium hassiacum DSM 44199]